MKISEIEQVEVIDHLDFSLECGLYQDPCPNAVTHNVVNHCCANDVFSCESCIAMADAFLFPLVRTLVCKKCQHKFPVGTTIDQCWESKPL